jgi:hypothetical protein
MKPPRSSSGASSVMRSLDDQSQWPAFCSMNFDNQELIINCVCDVLSMCYKLLYCTRFFHLVTIVFFSLYIFSFPFFHNPACYTGQQKYFLSVSWLLVIPTDSYRFHSLISNLKTELFYHP